jgi:2,4-dienoyl-CoA reductase-like NADH-dependent reductase (Old Yellow Enzyme family)
MNVHVSGRGYKNQTVIHDDSMTTGIKKLVNSLHQAGGKIA